MNLSRQAQRLQNEAQVFYFACKHPRVPWFAKVVAACTAAYLFSPVQLIPGFIPVIGFLDDLLVLFIGAKLIQKLIPPDVLTECRELAQAVSLRRNQQIRSIGSLVGFGAVALLWLLMAFAGSALMVAYIPR
jgi:uncharacterized membrane protein YkvA (DUF1232 family)